MRPKYKILTVLYAPPGTTGGSSQSSVSYGSGSTLGTTTASSHGFKQSYSVSVSAGLHILGGGSAGLSFSYGRNAIDSRSADIQKSTSTTLSQGGPAADGIDHDRDQIWLWLRPKMNATVQPLSSVAWTFDPSEIMNVQFVYVGHLKDPSRMPVGVKAQLDAAGLTTTDYTAILQADPFAFGDVAIDPARFAALDMTFPYEPPFAPGDTSPTLRFDADYTITSTTGTTTVYEHTAGVTIEGDVNFISVFKASLKTEDSWTWTDETTRSDAVGSRQFASVSVGGPAFGYTGPTDVAIYYDRIYKTFAFKFVQPFARTPPLLGEVVSSSGASVAGQEVVVVADGVRHRTFTNALGEFRVFAPRPAVLEVQAGGAQRAAASSGERIVVTVP